MESAELVSRLEALAREVAALRTRVARLEGAAGETGPADTVPAATVRAEAQPLAPGAGMMPAAGRLLLGLAGAFVLRAMADSGYLHPLFAVGLAAAYAGSWLVSAIRVARTSHVLAGAHVLTAALIAYPMVWETTMRFRALPPAAAAALLATFTVLGLAVTWKRDRGEIVWVTALAGTGSALGLLVATRDLTAFTGALLAIALAAEAGALTDQWLRVRVPVALAADLAVLLTGWLAGRPQGLPESYAAVSTAAGVALHLGLVAIYAGSVAFRVLARGKRIRYFEIGQNAAAFVIGLAGLVRIGKAEAAASALCLAAGLACYGVAFGLLLRRGPRDRTFLVYSAFGLLLLLGAPTLAEGGWFAAVLWGVGAVLATGLSWAPERRDLRFHATALAAAAVLVSGLALFSARALLGESQADVALVAIAFAAAAASYAMDVAKGPAGGPLLDTVPAFVYAGAVCWALLGFAALWAVPGGGGMAVVARTVLLAGAALGLRFAGGKFARPELLWMVYPVIGFAVYKLLVQDLRAQPAVMAASLVAFGGALLLLPRLGPRQPREA
jgi:hypothetical protein